MSLLFTDAHAVPSFARQTGMDCTTCHMSWLELTNVGRRFKLGGYQLMKQMDDDAKRPLVTFRFDTPPPLIPIAGALQFGITETQRVNTPGVNTANNTNTPGGFGTDFPSQNEFVLQQMSLFINGKLFDHVGCFCQFTYNSGGTTTSIDNFEIRAANTYSKGKFEAIYGLSLNDSPTMSDVWNTTPVFGWPYISSQVNAAPAASPIISQTLQTSAGGLTAYTLLGRTLYAEIGAYHNTDGVLSFLHFNVPRGSRYTLDGLAPYYRFALQHDWDKGHQSIEFGAFGLQPKVWQPQYNLGFAFTDTREPTGPSDNYVDRGWDAQYQYIYDKHRFSWMFSLIDEDSKNNGGTWGNGAANARDHLMAINTKVSYYYRKWYGASFGFQKETGSPDAGLYPNAFNDAVNPGGASAVNGSANNSPDSSAYIAELDYLFSTSGAQDHRKSRIILQYTAYTQFNGGNNNYAANGRNASDNNFWWLGLWLMY